MSAADLNRRFTDAINQREAAAFAALYAPNAVVRDPAYPAPLEGRDAIREDLEIMFRAFPDLRATIRSEVQDGEVFAAEGTFTGTHQGPLVIGADEIPPTGKRIEFGGASFRAMDGQGRILEERRYYDLAGLLAQLEVPA